MVEQSTSFGETDSRLCIYPCYLNSSLSSSKGRKIPKSKAVKDPTTPQIYDIVQKILQLPAEMERKRHPKDWRYLGRVRVSLQNSNGQYIKEEIKSRRDLMLKVAELLPKHPARSSDGVAKSSSASTAGKEQKKTSGGLGALPSRKKK